MRLQCRHVKTESKIIKERSGHPGLSLCHYGYATSFFLALCLLIKKQFFYIPYVSRKQESLIWLQATIRRKQMEREKFYCEMEEALMALKPEEMEIMFKRVNKQNRMGLHGC